MANPLERWSNKTVFTAIFIVTSYLVISTFVWSTFYPSSGFFPAISSLSRVFDYKSTSPIWDFDQFDLSNRRFRESINQKCAADKTSIIESYVNHNKLDEKILKWVWMVFPKLDLFYCAVPKCSSTTWKSYLVEATGCPACEWDPQEIDIHKYISIDPLKKKFTALSAIMRSKLDPLSWISSSRYAHRLMIVRSPWSRLVSAYKDKILSQQLNMTKKFCPNYPKYSHLTSTNTTFQHFVDCVVQRERHTLVNAHIHPISDLCAVCDINYTLIVKQEELQLNAPFVPDTLNITAQTKHYNPSRRLNPSHNKSSHDINEEISGYYRQLDDETIEKLREEYRNDIKLFDYPDSPFIF